MEIITTFTEPECNGPLCDDDAHRPGCRLYTHPDRLRTFTVTDPETGISKTGTLMPDSLKPNWGTER